MSGGFEQQSDSPETIAELRKLAGNASGRECWRGSMSGFWYARWHGADPPTCRRAASTQPTCSTRSSGRSSLRA